jgi:hypothetical protein
LLSVFPNVASCDLTRLLVDSAEDIIRHIDAVRELNTPLVFVATNHQQDHPILIALRHHYGANMLTWSDASRSLGSFGMVIMMMKGAGRGFADARVGEQMALSKP